MQTLLDIILSCLNCFTSYKLLYYFSATREQCRAQQDTAAGLQEMQTALHKEYIYHVALFFSPP